MTAPMLRPLRPEDLDRVSEIESRIVGHPRKEFLAKRFLAAEAAPEDFINCAAMDGGKLTGYGFARLQEGEFGARGAVAVLDIIGVDPDAQRKGIGKSVIAEIGRRMGERKIGAMRTQVAWANHGMIRFFSQAGFLLAPCRIIERNTTPLDDEIAEVTPPLGFNMFVLQTMSGRDSTYVAQASIPFFFMMVLAIALITIFPQIVTWLPDVVIPARK